jgi:hypothetical protein
VTPPDAPPALRSMTPLPVRVSRSGAVATLTLRFSVSEAARLRATVTPLRSARALPLVRGTTLAGASSDGASATANVPRGGVYAFRPRLAGARLVRGRTYIVRIVATDVAGHSSTLAIRARA